MLLSWINWLDEPGADVSASGALGALGAARLADPILRRRWRAPGAAAWFLADLGAAREVGVVALAQPDDAGGVDARGRALGWFAPGDTVRHRLDLAAPGGGAVWDTGAQPGGWQPGHGVHVAARAPLAPATARFWRCDLDCPSQAARGFLDAGRAWIGPAWRPSRHGRPEGSVNPGWQWEFRDGSAVSRNERSGLEFVDAGPRQRAATFGVMLTSEDDARAVRELHRVAGLGGQVLLVPRLSADAAALGQEAMVGRIERADPLAHRAFRVWDAAFTVRASL